MPGARATLDAVHHRGLMCVGHGRIVRWVGEDVEGDAFVSPHADDDGRTDLSDVIVTLGENVEDDASSGGFVHRS